MPFGVGDKLPDVTVYAGPLPDAYQHLYTTPAAAPGVYTLDKAKENCGALQASDHHK